jgi:hypothetical protein
MNTELTPPQFRRTLASNMPAGFDATFAMVEALVADFWANEKTARRFLINTKD